MLPVNLKIRIVCSEQTFQLILRNFEVYHHGSLKFVLQFDLPPIRGACLGCTGLSIGGSISCLSPAHFIFCNIVFPCVVPIPRIMVYVYSIIQITPLVMRTPPTCHSIPSDIIFPFYNSPLCKPRASWRVPFFPYTI